MKFAISFAATLALAALSGCSSGVSHGGWFDGSSKDLRHRLREERRVMLELAAEERLSIELPVGPIRVVVGEGPHDLRAVLEVQATGEERAREVLAASEIALERGAQGLSIRLVTPPESGQSTFRVAAELELSVPAGTRLEARTGAGPIEVTGALGDSRLRSSFGEVRAQGVRGALSVESGSGAVEVVDVRGGEVQAKSSFGQVTLRDVQGDAVRAESGSGTVHGESIRAATVLLHTRFGEVRGRSIEGRLEAKSGSGAIRIEDFRGELDVESSFGTVVCEGRFGSLSVRSGSGSVEVRALEGSRVESPWKVDSRFGAVKLAVPNDFACELHAKTGHGALDIGFPITVEAGGLGRSAREVRGRIGSGGGSVSLTSGSGAVSLAPRTR